MQNDTRIHTYLQCELQPDGMPCICDHLADEEYEDIINAQIKEANEYYD